MMVGLFYGITPPRHTDAEVSDRWTGYLARWSAVAVVL